MKKLASVFVVFFFTMLASCATINSMENNYEKIDYSDGVNKTEAVLIAKNHIMKTKYVKDYQIVSPVILNNEQTKKFSNIWFVRFHPKKITLLTHYYLVMISKETGEIISCGERHITGKERE